MLSPPTTADATILSGYCQRKKGREQHDQRSVIRQRTPPTTHGLTSSGSDSSPGNSANWTLTTGTCGVRPSSKYSNSHTGNASSNAAESSVVPALETVPRYTIAHPGARSSATRMGMSSERGVEGNFTNSYMSFSTSYSDTGLWGIYLVSENLGNLDDLMHFTLCEWTRMSIVPTA